MPSTQTLELPRAAGRPKVDPDLSTGSITFIGNATVLIRYAGFTVLTDPNFLHAGDHVHLGYGLKARRLKPPAMELEELPPVDLVVLSHLHGDHFDQDVEAKLNKDMPIITTPQAARKLADKGFRATRGVRCWDAVEVTIGNARLRITSTPARHGPPVAAKLLPETMGSLMEFFGPLDSPAFRLYQSGDTLVYDQLREIPRRFPDIDLGLFHLGKTMILGVLMVTMDSAQGVEAIQIINPDEAIPIHMDDYDVFKFSLDDFKRRVSEAGLADRLRYLDRGETYQFQVPAERWRGR